MKQIIGNESLWNAVEQKKRGKFNMEYTYNDDSDNFLTFDWITFT